MNGFNQAIAGDTHASNFWKERLQHRDQALDCSLHQCVLLSRLPILPCHFGLVTPQHVAVKEKEHVHTAVSNQDLLNPAAA